MSLLGKAVVAIWNDITPEGRANFFEWHNREHIPERVAIAGFHRGRRYVAIEAEPEFYTLYEARDAQVLVSEAYLARLNAPTPWTKEATSQFRNTLRGICPVIWSEGTGEGAFMATLRFDAQEHRSDMLMDHLVRSALPPLAELPGISGVHLCVADAAASGLETAERKGRQVDVPSWVVMIEGSLQEPVADAALRLRSIVDHGAAASPVTGLYRLEFSRVDPAPFA